MIIMGERLWIEEGGEIFFVQILLFLPQYLEYNYFNIVLLEAVVAEILPFPSTLLYL